MKMSVKILNRLHFFQSSSIWKVKCTEIKSEETLAVALIFIDLVERFLILPLFIPP